MKKEQLFKRIIEMFDLRLDTAKDLKTLSELSELKREVVNVLYEIDKLIK